MKNNIRQLTIAGVIAAMYVVLTYISSMFGLSSGVIQVRLSEVLTILPVFTVYAIPGLTVGCLLSNLLTGCCVLDIIFGTVATLIGAFGTCFLRKTYKAVAVIPPVLANSVIVPFVLKYGYGMENGIIFMFLTVLCGEIISCGIGGVALGFALEPRKKQIFGKS